MTIYNEKNTLASVGLQATTIQRRNSFNWGLTGYRPETSIFLESLRSKLSPTIKPFIKGNTVRDETRWLALYCTTDYYTPNVLICKTGLRRNTIEGFCKHYKINFKTRNFLGGAK